MGCTPDVVCHQDFAIFGRLAAVAVCDGAGKVPIAGCFTVCSPYWPETGCLTIRPRQAAMTILNDALHWFLALPPVYWILQQPVQVLIFEGGIIGLPWTRLHLERGCCWRSCSLALPLASL